MTLNEQIYITLLDKGFLAAIAGTAGFLFAWFLQEKKSRDEMLRELASLRAEAYKALWALTQPLAASEQAQIAGDERVKLDQDLHNWYYVEGKALFLSWGAAHKFLSALKELRTEDPIGEKTRDAFSALRTELKRDFGIYSRYDVLRRLPKPGPPLKRQQHVTKRRAES